MTAGTRGIGVLERISRLSPSKFSGLRRASNLGPLDHSKSKYSFPGALPARYTQPLRPQPDHSPPLPQPLASFFRPPPTQPTADTPAIPTETRGLHVILEERNQPVSWVRFFRIHRWFPARSGPLAVVARAVTICKLRPGLDHRVRPGSKHQKQGGY